MALTIQQVRCAKCGYRWFPRDGRTPARCPECKRRNPFERLRIASCRECGVEWEPRTEKPVRCVECGAGRVSGRPPKVRFAKRGEGRG